MSAETLPSELVAIFAKADESRIVTNENFPAAWEEQQAQALADVRAILGTGESRTRRTKPMGIKVSELSSLAFSAPTWLVQGLITLGGTAVIATEPKSAKTWAGTELAMAIATGTRAFGEFECQKRRTFYFYAEDIGRSVQSRIRALAAGRSVDPRTIDTMVAVPRGEFIDVTRDEDVADIVASVRAHGGADLVVLDPLRDIHSGEEDKSDSMGQVMRRIRAIGEILQCTVLIVHHAGKASKETGKRRPGQKMRGSGAIHGSIDSGIYLEDLEGDQVTEFRNTVRSELKNARSAGTFSLALKIEDGAEGTAVRASWSVAREAENRATTMNAESAQKAADDTAIMVAVTAEFRAGSTYTRRQWRLADCVEIHKVPEKRASAALKRLIDKGTLTMRKANDEGFGTRYARVVPAGVPRTSPFGGAS